MGFLVPAGIMLGFVALVGWAIYSSHVAETKRKDELQRVADELAFEFLPLGDPTLFQSLGQFHLFSQGHAKRLWNLLRGTTNDLEVAIFDYRYTIGSGKHKQTRNHTVISFRFAGDPLPQFSLRPENFADKIGGWFGYQDIDFDTYPAFSKQYWLRGANEEAVRAIFTTTVLDYFQKNPGLTTEASGNTLLFYRHSSLLKTTGSSFLHDAGLRHPDAIPRDEVGRWSPSAQPNKVVPDLQPPSLDHKPEQPGR